MEESKRTVRFTELPSHLRTAIADFSQNSGLAKASDDVVSIERQHPLLRDISEGGNQRRAGFPDYCQERSSTGG